MILSNGFNTPKSRNCSTINFIQNSSKRPETWDEFDFFKVFIRIRDFPSFPKKSFIVRKVNNSMVRLYHGKESKDFIFDHVFDEFETTKSLFTGAIQPALEGLFEGYNSTIMAYGMTGSGKTHTMLGEINDITVIDQNPGLIYLAVKDIFWKIHLQTAMDKNWDFVLQMSYLEIYNEQIHDLLNESPINLQILEDPIKGPVVQGLLETNIKSPQEIIELINIGNSRRVVAETSSNKFSSRSHAILILNLQKKHRVEDPNKIIHAKLVMADLAGSERACVSGNKGVRMIEGGNINRSLLALGNCIKMLSENAPKINYRDSKLTRLLKESLGGNTRSIMITCLSPLENHYEESLNSLKYAFRMKQIKVKAMKNIKEEEMDMELAIKLDEEHRMMSLNSFSNNLMINLEEIIEINKLLQGLKEKNQNNIDLLDNENLSIERKKGIESFLRENSIAIQNLELKFRDKCQEKETLFMKLIDQLGINSINHEKNKDLQIFKLNKEIQRLKNELKEKNKMLQSNELIEISQKVSHSTIPLRSINSEKKARTFVFPKNITEIRKYYKMRSDLKFSEDIPQFQSSKKQKQKKVSNSINHKRKDYSNTILQRFPTTQAPSFTTKYQDFKLAYNENSTKNISSNQKPLPISDMSSINNDRLSIDSLIFDKDIDEHAHDIIELKNFIKKDSKLKSKNDIDGILSSQLKSLNTTHNLNMTQRLFNDGYYSEEVDNVKERRKMYKSVRDIIKKQREHLNEEYKKLQNGNDLKTLFWNDNATNFFSENKLKKQS